MDVSADGRHVLLSDYENETLIYTLNSGTGEYEMSQLFDTLADFGAPPNVTDYFVTNVEISQDPEAKYIILSNVFSNYDTNETIENVMLYVKSTATGDYDFHHSFELDPE